MTPWDEAFPSALRAIELPPPVCTDGDVGALYAGPLIAVVGTRRPTLGGGSSQPVSRWRSAARRVTVVSGLAMGIDGAAHAAVTELGA